MFSMLDGVELHRKNLIKDMKGGKGESRYEFGVECLLPFLGGKCTSSDIHFFAVMIVERGLVS